MEPKYYAEKVISITLVSHFGPWNKSSTWSFLLNAYIIPKSLKVSHWLSKINIRLIFEVLFLEINLEGHMSLSYPGKIRIVLWKRTTPWKFNIAPENKPSQKEVIFQSSFFRGYVELRGCMSRITLKPMLELEHLNPQFLKLHHAWGDSKGGRRLCSRLTSKI